MNKKWITVIAVAILAILVAVWWRHDSKIKSAQQNNTKQSGSQATQQPATTTPRSSTQRSGSISGYTKAVQTYSNRIQFNGCQAIINNQGNIGTLVISKGTKFMLDNRGNAAITIAFKGYSVRIAAYGYAIATASTLGNYPLTCNGGGSAWLNVE